MNGSRTSVPLRWISTILLGAVLVLIAVLAVLRSRALAEEEGRLSAARARTELSTVVGIWDGLIGERIASWLVDLPDAPDLRQREQQVRQQVSWFDAFYEWERGPGGPRLTYPWAPPKDLQPLLASPCMRKAHGLAVMGNRDGAARSFLACQGPPPERLLANSLAARNQQDLGRSEEAWQTLYQADPPLLLPFVEAAEAGLSLRRLLTRRMLAIEVLDALSRRAEALDLAQDSFAEIVALSGPDLEALLPTAERLFRVDLASALSEEEVADCEARLGRARRRVAGFLEVQERLSRIEDSQITPTGPNLPGGIGRLRVMHDMYSDPGFILVWAPLGDSGRSAAAHLDGMALLENLVRAERNTEESGRRIAIIDATSQPVAGLGDPPPEALLLADVPLGWLFPHLRIGVLSTPGEALQRQVEGVLVQLLPMGVAMALGVLAIAVQLAANRRERELFDRQQAFIARVTHELKTPLAGIRVMAETLQMGAATEPATARKFLDRIIQETEKLGNRIDEVLTAARRPEVSERTPVRLDALAQEVVDTWRPRFQQAGAELTTDLRPCHPVPADPPLMRDALGNLLDNALKYQRPGVKGRCVVRTAETGRWVIFEVVDNGMGVPPAMRRRIFERFTRVEGPGRGKAGGHGLGLAFVAEAAAAHKGTVECSEGLDGGARFRLKLRRKR